MATAPSRPPNLTDHQLERLQLAGRRMGQAYRELLSIERGCRQARIARSEIAQARDQVDALLRSARS